MTTRTRTTSQLRNLAFSATRSIGKLASPNAFAASPDPAAAGSELFAHFTRGREKCGLALQVSTWVNTQHSAILLVKLYSIQSLGSRRPFATFDGAIDHVNGHAKAR
jgi:hypothetical protein